MTEIARCQICGEPMPPGEEMFNFHGYSGNCPKPPLRPTAAERDALRAEHQRLKGDVVLHQMLVWELRRENVCSDLAFNAECRRCDNACAALAAFEAQHPEVVK